ncbi:hypothetical protein Tco_0905737, partial [Tanacetum coccineum]
MTMSNLPSLIIIRSILKGIFVMGGIFCLETRRLAMACNVIGSDFFQVAGPLFLAVLGRWPTLLQILHLIVQDKHEFVCKRARYHGSNDASVQGGTSTGAASLMPWLEASLEMWRGFWRPRLKKGAQGGDVASLVAKERNRVDTAYWDDPIRRIEYESASIVVEIDLTWSLGFILVKLAYVVAQISLIKLEFSSCLFADSLMNLLRVSSIDCLHS